MAKSVKINGVTYPEVPSVDIPLASGSGNATFYDTSEDNVSAGDILTGKTAHGAAGPVSGAMPDNGSVAGEIATKDGKYTVPAGKHSGSGTVSIAQTEQAKIVTGNIRAGVTVLGVTGKNSVVDTADADASAATILSGKSAYVNGQKVNGTMTAATVSQDGSTKVLSIS